MIDIPDNVDEIIMIDENTAICALVSKNVKGVFNIAIIKKDEHVSYLESRTKYTPLKTWIEELDRKNSDMLLGVDSELKRLCESKGRYLERQNLFQSALNCNSYKIGSL